VRVCASWRTVLCCARRHQVRSESKRTRSGLPGLSAEQKLSRMSSSTRIFYKTYTSSVACDRGLYRDEEWFWDSLRGTTAGGWRIIGLTVNRFPRDSHGDLESEMNNPPLWSCTWRARAKARERLGHFGHLSYRIFSETVVCIYSSVFNWSVYSWHYLFIFSETLIDTWNVELSGVWNIS